jgi:hypothetical protein
MEIDLNSAVYVPPIDLLMELISKIPDELIYYKYLGDSFKVGGVINSPFRVDPRPSFGVFYNNSKLIYNDFGNDDSGDISKFILKYYREVLKLTSLQSMIAQFKYDFSELREDYKLSKNITYLSGQEFRDIKQKNKEFKLEIRITKFSLLHLRYWRTFGISESTLKAFNVFPISHYFINGKGYFADPVAFAYIETKDNKLTIKIYQPFSNRCKWISNTNFSVHQGYRMLPGNGPILIITKSLKDVMSLREVLDIPAIGVQGEKSRMKESVRAEYLTRFNNVFCLFDNDREGLNLSNFFKDNYKIDYILIPDELNSKDFSDLVKKVGTEQAKKVITNILNKKLNEELF